jgi:hypothetical protein
MVIVVTSSAGIVAGSSQTVVMSFGCRYWQCGGCVPALSQQSSAHVSVSIDWPSAAQRSTDYM